MKLYPNNPTSVIAEKINRSISSVYGRANYLGINKDADFLLRQNQILGKKLSSSDNGHRFPKGHTPLNKGVKMSAEVYEKAKHTMFRKGNLPHGTLCDRAITLRRDSKTQRPYWWVRIALANWKMYHLEIWERENGPVPSGHVIVFKDKNSLNCVIENLEMITLRENMLRNTIQNYPLEIKQIIKLTHKLNRKIREKQN